MASHQPFHWFIEFHGVIKDGGFGVVLGNPPYISSRNVRKTYTTRGYVTEQCPDIYAWIMERSTSLVSLDGRFGMIVPLSLTFSGAVSDASRFAIGAVRIQLVFLICSNPGSTIQRGGPGSEYHPHGMQERAREGVHDFNTSLVRRGATPSDREHALCAVYAFRVGWPSSEVESRGPSSRS